MARGCLLSGCFQTFACLATFLEIFGMNWTKSAYNLQRRSHRLKSNWYRIFLLDVWIDKLADQRDCYVKIINSSSAYDNTLFITSLFHRLSFHERNRHIQHSNNQTRTDCKYRSFFPHNKPHQQTVFLKT